MRKRLNCPKKKLHVRAIFRGGLRGEHFFPEIWSAPPHPGGEHKGEQNVVPQDSQKICTRFTHKSLNLPLQYAKKSRASRENLNIPFKIHKNMLPFKNPNISY